MTRRRKVCFDLTGRNPAEKDRIIKRIEQVIDEFDSPPQPQEPSSEVIDEEKRGDDFDAEE